GPEQTAHHRELAALHLREEQCRSPGLIDPPLDLGGFEVGIDLLLDAHELCMPFQIDETFAQVAMGHGKWIPNTNDNVRNPLGRRASEDAISTRLRVGLTMLFLCHGRQLPDADIAEVQIGGRIVTLQTERAILEPAAVAGTVLDGAVI